MEPLLPSFRRELRARAHRLHPVVSIGHQGLTPAVLHEIDVALAAHELLKVRVMSDDRDERAALLDRICAEVDCAPVQQIGKLLVLWRPRRADASPEPPRKGKRPERARKGGAPMRKGSAPRTQPRGSGHPPARPPGGDVHRRTATGRTSATSPIANARRKTRTGKAPPGVPRAALPRRRRGTVL